LVDVSLSAWFVILLAALAANLPFLNERLLAVVPLSRGIKPVWLRLIELGILYLLVGLLAFLLEGRIGRVHSQGWEFYVVTICLFLVLAFPGFVLRHLRRKQG
jgi:hypothetical protein